MAAQIEFIDDDFEERCRRNGENCSCQAEERTHRQSEEENTHWIQFHRFTQALVFGFIAFLGEFVPMIGPVLTSIPLKKSDDWIEDLRHQEDDREKQQDRFQGPNEQRCQDQQNQKPQPALQIGVGQWRAIDFSGLILIVMIHAKKPLYPSPGFAVSNRKRESERFLALNTRHL
jgi:hypothetical protein